jgi:hypothetical protein
MAQVGDKQEAWSSKFSIATLPQILESDVVVHTPVIPALERLRQKDCEFKDSLCYTVRL